MKYGIYLVELNGGIPSVIFSADCADASSLDHVLRSVANIAVDHVVAAGGDYGAAADNATSTMDKIRAALPSSERSEFWWLPGSNLRVIVAAGGLT